jgi:hypothetical protein
LLARKLQLERAAELLQDYQVGPLVFGPCVHMYVAGAYMRACVRIHGCDRGALLVVLWLSCPPVGLADASRCNRHICCQR